MAELAEQHADELCPAGKAFGRTLSGALFDQRGELVTRKMLEQLIEEAGYLYDGLALPVGSVWRNSWVRFALAYVEL